MQSRAYETQKPPAHVTIVIAPTAAHTRQQPLHLFLHLHAFLHSKHSESF